MPTVSVYIRKEDYVKWIALEKPGEFIHNALNGVGGTHIVKANDKLYVMNGQDPIKRYDATTEEVAPKDLYLPTYKVKPVKTPTGTLYTTNIGPVIKTPKDAEKAMEAHKNPTSFPLASHVKLCKIHGTPLDGRGFCLIKGCKYGPKV